jgi:hypothetical protein
VHPGSASRGFSWIRISHEGVRCLSTRCLRPNSPAICCVAMEPDPLRMAGGGEDRATGGPICTHRLRRTGVPDDGCRRRQVLARCCPGDGAEREAAALLRVQSLAEPRSPTTRSPQKRMAGVGAATTPKAGLARAAREESHGPRRARGGSLPLRHRGAGRGWGRRGLARIDRLEPGACTRLKESSTASAL